MYGPRGGYTRDALELEEGENREWGRLAGWAARVAAEHAILSGRWKCALEERSALILNARSASTRGSAPLTHGPPATIADGILFFLLRGIWTRSRICSIHVRTQVLLTSVLGVFFSRLRYAALWTPTPHASRGFGSLSAGTSLQCGPRRLTPLAVLANRRLERPRSVESLWTPTAQTNLSRFWQIVGWNVLPMSTPTPHASRCHGNSSAGTAFQCGPRRLTPFAVLANRWMERPSSGETLSETSRIDELDASKQASSGLFKKLR